MLSKKVLDLLNKQIGLEEYSSNLYLAMGSWCLNHGFEGTGTFLVKHAEEERFHMKKLFNYVIEKGELAIVSAVDAPPTEYKSILAMFEEILNHEQFITKSVNEIVEVSMNEKDFSAFNFLQWFVAEQHEEEMLFQGIIDKIKLIGLEGQGKFLIDQEIAKIAASKTIPSMDTTQATP